MVVVRIAAEDLELVARELAWNTAHGGLEGTFRPAAFVGSLDNRKLHRKVTNVRERRAGVDVAHALHAADRHLHEPQRVTHLE